jgi:hypothetical protein
VSAAGWVAIAAGQDSWLAVGWRVVVCGAWRLCG